MCIRDSIYTCTFSLDKYCAAVEFTLNEIVFMDGSVRKNIRLYGYMDDGFYDAQTMEKVLTSEPVKLTVLPTEKYVITTVDEVLNDAADIAEGGTVVIGGIDAEMTEPMALPEQFISQAVEKKLTVIIPSVYGMSEVLIKGSDLAALKNKDYTIAVNQYEWFNEEMTVGNKVNDMFCPCLLYTSTIKCLLKCLIITILALGKFMDLGEIFVVRGFDFVFGILQVKIFVSVNAVIDVIIIGLSLIHIWHHQEQEAWES